MSLINNMLKEIEKRENTSPHPPTIVLASAVKKMPRFNLENKSFWISVILSLLVSMVLVTVSTKKNNSTLSPISQAKTATTTPTPLNNENSWLTRTTISGISLQEKDHITDISFMLDHPALYRLVSNDASNQLTIYIDNAQLQSNIPQIQSLHTALRSIHAQSIDNNVVISMTLLPDSIIKYVNLNTDSKNPELVIAIEHSDKSTAPSNTASNDMVKMPAMQTLYLQQYQAALSHAQHNEFNSAIQSLTTLLDAQPSYLDARVSLAALIIDQGNPIKASKIINEGLRLNPDAIPLIELKARLLTSQGKIKQALTLLQSESPPITDNPEYHAFIAALYQKNDHNLLAVQLYKRLLTLNPQNGNWWFGLGLSLEKLGEKSLAYDAYNKAIANGNVNQESLAYLQHHMQSLQEIVNDEK